MTILVLTVGGSYQPLVTAIQSLKPERVVFLCSDDTPRAKGSYLQVIGNSKVVKSDPKLEKPDLPNIVVQTALSPDRYELVKIENFDSLEECYLESRKVLEKLHDQYSEARLIADYTGGTKSMTAGLAVAAVDDERCEISLVTGTRADLEKVQDLTQFARPAVVWNLRGKRKLEEVQFRLSRYDYAGAGAILETIGRMPISESFLRNVTADIAICRGLDAWDRFNHQEAKDLLNPYRKFLVQECIILEDLCRTEPRDPYLRVEDLLLNAERRAAQGRYDDAIARIYRALELIAQTRLRTKHGIDTANVDLLKVPEPTRPDLERYRSENGNIQIPLFATWSLLEAMDNEPLGAWFAKHQSLIKGFLGTRNFSILAHGDRPIDEQAFQSVGSRGLALCREALASIPAAERKKPEVKQLPDRLRYLEED